MTDLQDVEFVDSRHGFIVGEEGFVARTDDGGETWTRDTWGTATLRDIFMINTHDGFVAGDEKTILQTTDGGDYFYRMQLPTDMIEREEDFWAIYALSLDEAWALGHQEGAILKWDGEQWNYDIGIRRTGYPYTGLAMVSSDRGWAITASSTDDLPRGDIYRYTDGQWYESTSLRTNRLYAIEMYSPRQGWAAGGGGVVATYADGDWAEVSPISGLAFGRVTGLHVLSPDDIWATAGIGEGAQADGAIYRYRANDWQQMEYTYTAALNAIWVDDTLTNGWAVGDDGLIMRYVIPPN